MQIQDELARFTADAQYFDQHRQELLRQFPERWVAVYHEKVVGAARDLKGLVKQLERKGIPRGRAYVDFVSAQEDLLILSRILVPQSQRDQLALRRIPSLLGRDILAHFALYFEERTDRVLLLEPHEADALPLP